MEPTTPWSSKTQDQKKKQFAPKQAYTSREFITTNAVPSTPDNRNDVQPDPTIPIALDQTQGIPPIVDTKKAINDIHHETFDSKNKKDSENSIGPMASDDGDTLKLPKIKRSISIDNTSGTQYPLQQTPEDLRRKDFLADIDTQAIPVLAKRLDTPAFSPGHMASMAQRQTGMTRSRALVVIALLCIVLFSAFHTSSTQFIGSQGWAYVLAGSTQADSHNLLNDLKNKLSVHSTPGAATHAALTPGQYIDFIIKNMTQDQKLGQMMLVQFIGAEYSNSFLLSTMVTQNNVGAIILSSGNSNIVKADQLKQLTQQIQQNAQIPLLISTDQEGGDVDRLKDLDGARPSASDIGASNHPATAKAAGLQDAQDLFSYGLNLNLAPVVDVDNQNGSIMHKEGRTFGTDAATVTKMAAAYLQGLQQGGKVFGTLKHFPGLGDVIGDPHQRVTQLNRSKDQMEQIDWAPYAALIQQNLVHSIMVTHEVVPAIDRSLPASLSAKVVQGILRNEMGFQGVIITDSLNMDGVAAYADFGQAAAMAVEAGSDLLMGAKSPDEVGIMIKGIKDAMSVGTISQQRIDESVRRILLMKYQMGLISIPKN